MALSAKPTVAGTMRTQEGDLERAEGSDQSPSCFSGWRSKLPQPNAGLGSPSRQVRHHPHPVHAQQHTSQPCHRTPTSSEGKPTGADRGQGRQQHWKLSGLSETWQGMWDPLGAQSDLRLLLWTEFHPLVSGSPEGNGEMPRWPQNPRPTSPMS